MKEIVEVYNGFTIWKTQGTQRYYYIEVKDDVNYTTHSIKEAERLIDNFIKYKY